MNPQPLHATIEAMHDDKARSIAIHLLRQIYSALCYCLCLKSLQFKGCWFCPMILFASGKNCISTLMAICNTHYRALSNKIQQILSIIDS